MLRHPCSNLHRLLHSTSPSCSTAAQRHIASKLRPDQRQQQCQQQQQCLAEIIQGVGMLLSKDKHSSRAGRCRAQVTDHCYC
jgi:hypothetical protein